MSELSSFPATLTKENFWNGMQEKYPEQMEAFSKWIDDYKKKNGWWALFTGEIFNQEKDIKYHDIPTAMQVGIFMQFMFDEKKVFFNKRLSYYVDHHFLDGVRDMEDFIDVIEKYFRFHKNIKSRV